MKKLLIILAMVVGFYPVVIMAETITATWRYVNPPPDLVGFEIYADEDSVWKGNDPSQRTCSFECSLTGEPVDFTITAYDASTESVHSEAYPVDPMPPAPMSLTVSELE